MLYKLIQRAFPDWFPYNSLHVMQPMFTKETNEQIATKIGTINQYTNKGPAKPAVPTIVQSHSMVRKVLMDQNGFGVSWQSAMDDLFPGDKDYFASKLCGHAQLNTMQENLVWDVVYGSPQFKGLLTSFIATSAKHYLNAEQFNIGGHTEQIDILRE